MWCIVKSKVFSSCYKLLIWSLLVAHLSGCSWFFAPKFWEMAGTYELSFCLKRNAASMVLTLWGDVDTQKVLDGWKIIWTLCTHRQWRQNLNFMHSQAVETQKLTFRFSLAPEWLQPNNDQVEKLSLPNINRLVFNFMMCEHSAIRWLLNYCWDFWESDRIRWPCSYVNVIRVFSQTLRNTRMPILPTSS